MKHFSYMNDEDLPSPVVAKKKALLSKKVTAKPSPMVVAHFSKGELATLDRLQGGRTMDKQYGIPHYKGLKPIFDNPAMLHHLQQTAKPAYAKGGSIKHMERAKASMGRMGDTERAAIPRNMADFMDRMGLSTKNPYTGDREYALGNNFISSLGNFIPTFAKGASEALSSSGSSTPTSTPTPTASSSGSSGSGGVMGSLFESLVPAALDAGAKWLTKPKGDAGTTGNQTAAPSAAPQTSPTPTPAPTAGGAQQPQPQAQAQSQAGAQGGMDSGNIMQQLQQLLMQQGQNYLSNRNDPYSRFAGQMLGRYQQGGAQGVANQLPYDLLNQLIGGNMQQQMPYGMPQGGGGYSPEQYNPQPQYIPTAPTRRGAPSRRTGYR